MKKLAFVLLAATLAFGFSAFTPSQTTLVKYFNGEWKEAEVTPCPSGTIPVCMQEIAEEGYAEFQIYHISTGNPYTRSE